MNAHVAQTTPESILDPSCLLARLRQGDEQAYEFLVRQHTGRLLAVARRYLPNEEDARDAVQDGLLAAFRSLDQFHGDAQIGTWLHRIVVNAALMKLRRRRARPEVSLDGAPALGYEGTYLSTLESSFPAVDEEYGRQQLQALVRECVQELPEHYRSVYLLRDVEELSTEEVAEALGISRNAVKIRLHRARQALVALVRCRCVREEAVAS